jgi:hydroxylamine dehydrogenase
VVRKVRWGFLPFKSIADNLEHPWFKERKDAWAATCSQCHAPRFAQTYLTMMDDGIKLGTGLVEQSRKVMQKLYDDKLLVGQKTNRTPLPAPEKDEPGGFSSLFFATNNQTTVADRTFAEMWEQHVARYMKGLEHVNPGGWTYSHGWSDLIKDQTIINEQDTVLRENARMEQRLRNLESGRAKTSFLNRSPDDGPQSVLAAVTDDPLTSSLALSLLGGTLVVGGASTVRRRRRLPGRQASDATTLPEQETR